MILHAYEETFYYEKKRFWPQSNGGIETRVGVCVTSEILEEAIEKEVTKSMMLVELIRELY